MLRNVILALAGVPLITIPLAPLLASTEPANPPSPSPQSMVMDLLMVTVPNPPGLRQSISPLAAVLKIAPAKVLHGELRLQGLASLPVPETQVRVAWAWARDVPSIKTTAKAAVRQS